MRENFLSARARGIVPYTAGEQPKGASYIKLNTNENPYPPAPGVQAFLREVNADELRRYPRPEAEELAAAVAEARGVRPENVFLANGSDEVLAQSFLAFFDPDGGDVVFPDVTYSFYPVYAALFGIPYRTLPLSADYSVHIPDYCSLKNAQGIVLANPNAPTGRAVAVSEIERIVRENPDRLVIADEAYADFWGQTAAPLTKKYPNLLVVQTFSKSYSLAGIRCGYALGDARLVEGLKRVRDSYNSYPLDRLCQGVCLAAVKDASYYAECTRRVVSVRERTREALSRMGFEALPSESNFLFVRKPGVNGGKLYLALKERGMLVRHFSGPRVEDFLRVTVGTDEEMAQFTAALGEIAAFGGGRA